LSCHGACSRACVARGCLAPAQPGPEAHFKNVAHNVPRQNSYGFDRNGSRIGTGVKDNVEPGEALGIRRRKLVEEMPVITASEKCGHKCQGDGAGRSTVEGVQQNAHRGKGPDRRVFRPTTRGRDEMIKASCSLQELRRRDIGLPFPFVSQERLFNGNPSTLSNSPREIVQAPVVLWCPSTYSEPCPC